MTKISDFHKRLILEQAGKFGVEPALIAAICQRESDFNADAMRLEDGYRWLWRVGENAGRLKITFRTEEKLQSFSYGLMQLMGATARSCGFLEPLPVLLDPQKNLEFGCRYLMSLFDRFGKLGKNVEAGWCDAVVAAYNAGSPRRVNNLKFVNEGYVRAVEGFYKEFATGDFK